MTADRHLALMTLMTEIQEPSRAYFRSTRQAAAAFTDSPEWDRAVGRGGQALDAIETAVRHWVETHRPQPLPGRCGTPSPDGRFACALAPHTNAVMHADRTDADVTPKGKRMVWETPVETPAGFERITGLTVKCAACSEGYDEGEGVLLFDSVREATAAVVDAGWAELKDGRVLCAEHDEGHEALRSTVCVVDQDGAA
ncbi:hypothetical protein [Streptomyces fructofermentans]|uniref:Uncharacterized protein n=1 Tax=Streptomyces fructofermentans TaxID=152141 RepID=A0A918NV85_9ACTN|nr:hypothetical protein [Streptomyces fructofermentans]GGX99082.1 hypothetical protein GCM10010515_76560 [Streptomyces fructofermentans]